MNVNYLHDRNDKTGERIFFFFLLIVVTVLSPFSQSGGQEMFSFL